MTAELRKIECRLDVVWDGDPDGPVLVWQEHFDARGRLHAERRARGVLFARATDLDHHHGELWGLDDDPAIGEWCHLANITISASDFLLAANLEHLDPGHRDAQLGIGYALVSIGRELAAVRDELGQVGGVTAAVRELTRTIERQGVEVVDALVDVRREVCGEVMDRLDEAARHLSDLADVAVALQAEVLPRRSWWARVCSRFGRSATWVEESALGDAELSEAGDRS